MRIGLVVPHIFMQRDILPRVIFSPGRLALRLAEGLQSLGAEVTLFTPGAVDTPVRNLTADLSYFEHELAGRSDSYLGLLKKHPFTFITLARQVQSELVAKAYAMANDGQLDVVHVYTNEEDIALPFAALCRRPVVFTHHDPFNFLVKYKNVFPKYRHLNWLSMSLAQRAGMPPDTNWAGNIYHGLDPDIFRAPPERTGAAKVSAGTAGSHRPHAYIAYLGRIIEAKGVHLAIEAVQAHNAAHPDRPYQLRLGGKHYAGAKDRYWQQRIAPRLDGRMVAYDGFIAGDDAKRRFLADASALVIPSTFQEPFGMVMIEALACGTPVVGLDSGAISEVVKSGQTGWVAAKAGDEAETARRLAAAIGRIGSIDRTVCRRDFEERFTLERMCAEHLAVYERLRQAEA